MARPVRGVPGVLRGRGTKPRPGRQGIERRKTCRHGGPRARRAGLPRMWRHHQRSVPVQPELPVLPSLPDRRQGPGRPPPLEAAQVSAGGTATARSSTEECAGDASPSGRVLWFNEGLSRWVLWEAGSDAPPLPRAGSRTEAVAAPPAGAPPGNAMSTRGSMRSPYRIVPLVIAVIVVVLALWEATRPPATPPRPTSPPPRPSRASAFSRKATSPSFPVLSPTPVSCSAPKAYVKVVAVLVPGIQAPASWERCGASASDRRGGEPSECILPVKH